MKACIFSLLVVFLFSCNSNTESNNTIPKDSTAVAVKEDTPRTYIHRFADTLLEDKITGVLMKLPFIKKANAYIDSFSEHKHGIAFMVDSLGKNETEIYVQAGYNGDQRFETYYSFYVNPKTMAIQVYDVVNDKKMTVKEYIKSQQH